mgnify:FL=1
MPPIKSTLVAKSLFLKVIDSELSLDSIQMNLSDFSKGVYFVEISNDFDIG